MSESRSNAAAAARAAWREPSGDVAAPLSGALAREHRVIDDVIVAVVHGDDAQGRTTDDLVAALGVLRRHIYAEEEIVFPPLRDAGLVGPILVMLREHAEMWQLLDQLDTLIAAGTADGEVRETCARLLDLLQRHNPKEETILYPQADELLGPIAAAGLRRFLAAGDVPIDWQCHRIG